MKYIIPAALVCVAAAVLVCGRMPPVYESTATIDVDCRVPVGVLGTDAARGGTEDADAFIATQVRLIQSDAVLRRVALRYGLFNPREQRPTDAPVVLPSLRVTRPPSTYLILITFRASDRQLAADVANAIAESYLEMVYETRHRSSTSAALFMTKELDEVKQRVEASAAQLMRFERELNFINPEQKTSMLSARLTQLNTEYANAQADRLKKQSAYESIRNGEIEAAEVSAQGEPLRRAVEMVHQAEQKFAEAESRYGINHPEYAKAQFQAVAAKKALREYVVSVGKRVAAEYDEAARREAMLADTLVKERAQFDRLNSRAVQYQSLRAAAEGDRKLYEELQRRVKEATINSGFRNSAVRIADQARPGSRPVSPNVSLAVLLALVLSVGGGVGLAIVLDSVDDRVHDADQINKHFGGDPGVAGTLPRFHAGDVRRAPQTQSLSAVGPATRMRRFAMFENAIRALRIAVLRNWDPTAGTHSSGTEPPRSLLVTSSGPNEGKSTVALGLAVASARQGARTLLIDASLESADIHRLVGIDESPGLSDVLMQEMPWRDAVTSAPDTPRLSVLPAGSFRPGAHDQFAQGMISILLQAYEFFDAVIIDSHDVNYSADTLQLATFVHGVLIVARAGRTRLADLQKAVDSLRWVHADVNGFVLNEFGSKTKRPDRPLATVPDSPAARALVQRPAE